MRRALAIDESSYGLEHPNVAIDLNNLAQLLKATDRLAEAEPLMQRALAIDESSLRARASRCRRPAQRSRPTAPATDRLAEAEPLSRPDAGDPSEVHRDLSYPVAACGHLSATRGPYSEPCATQRDTRPPHRHPDRRVRARTPRDLALPASVRLKSPSGPEQPQPQTGEPSSQQQAPARWLKPLPAGPRSRPSPAGASPDHPDGRAAKLMHTLSGQPKARQLPARPSITWSRSKLPLPEPREAGAWTRGIAKLELGNEE